MRPLALLALVALAAGCGGETTSAPRAANEVTMAKSYRFEPETLEVDAGTRVTFRNDDNFTHTVQVEGHDDLKVGRGESVSVTFSERGTYRYVCTLHPDMEGTVVVR